MSRKVDLIPPEAYPQMLSKAQSAKFSQALRGTAAAAKAKTIIVESASTLCAAVLAYVEELEAAGADMAVVSDKAHEIKGFADTAGLPATARIAEGLCRYLEESDGLGAAPDADVVALHVSAIGLATRDADHGSRMSDVVVRELASLSARRLAEIAARNS